MAVHSLQEHSFEVAKNEVQSELTNYFVNKEEQRTLWHLTLSVNLNARGHRFSLPQAERLIADLVKNYGIRRADIQAAVAFCPTRFFKVGENPKIIRFTKGKLLTETFEKQLVTLYELIQRKIIEFRHALELVLTLLDNYPAARRMFA